MYMFFSGGFKYHHWSSILSWWVSSTTSRIPNIKCSCIRHPASEGIRVSGQISSWPHTTFGPPKWRWRGSGKSSMSGKSELVKYEHLTSCLFVKQGKLIWKEFQTNFQTTMFYRCFFLSKFAKQLQGIPSSKLTWRAGNHHFWWEIRYIFKYFFYMIFPSSVVWGVSITETNHGLESCPQKVSRGPYEHGAVV